MDNIKVSKETVCSTVFCFLGVINFFLKKYGMYPIEIEESVMFDFVSAVWLIAGVIVAWWKNNSFTKPAIIADGVMKHIKAIEPIDYTELKVDVQKVEKEEEEDLAEINSPEVE